LAEFNNETRFVDPNSLSENYVNAKFILKRKTIPFPDFSLLSILEKKSYSCDKAKSTIASDVSTDAKSSHERQRAQLQSPLPNFSLQRKQHSLPYIPASNLAHAEAQANSANSKSGNVVRREKQVRTHTHTLVFNLNKSKIRIRIISEIIGFCITRTTTKTMKNQFYFNLFS
jgi:hypothetical protein